MTVQIKSMNFIQSTQHRDGCIISNEKMMVIIMIISKWEVTSEVLPELQNKLLSMRESRGENQHIKNEINHLWN